MARAPGSRGRGAARRQLARIADLLERAYGAPEFSPRSDLVGSLVATILSQNTSDTNASRAYARLRERFPVWESVARSPVNSIESAIRPGGLARTKARRIRAILREIASRTGEVDLAFLRSMSTEEVLRHLRGFEGVGRKTAACVALFGLGRDVMPVDTHVHRVVGRLGVVGAPRDPDATYEALRAVVPSGRSLSLHVNIIRLGRSLCRPGAPSCARCPVRRLCQHFRGRGRADGNVAAVGPETA